MKFNTRNILGYGYAKLLIWNGSVKKVVNNCLAGEYILSIYFHNPEAGMFEKCVKWLHKNKFVFLSVDDLNQIRIGNKAFPKGGVIITVDDGWKENIPNIVMTSVKYSIPVTIFITLEPLKSEKSYWWSYVKKANEMKKNGYDIEDLKKTNNSDRMKVIDKLRKEITIEKESVTETELMQMLESSSINIGSHTITHPILTRCTYNRVVYEIKNSKNQLEKITGKTIKYFAYPNGNYGEREISLLKDNGYTLAFSTKTEYLNETNLIKRYEYPRFELLENVSFAENICRITGVWFKTK